MNGRRWLGFFIGSVLLPCHAFAASRLLAVLPLDVRMTQGAVSVAARASIEEAIRDAAIERIARSGWSVLTEETTLQVLRDNGIDPSRCGDESCHLTIAREINVGVFISGTVQLDAGELTASIRLIDTDSGRVLSAVMLSGPTTKTLREQLADKATALFVDAGLINPAPQPDTRPSWAQAPAAGQTLDHDAASQRTTVAQDELDATRPGTDSVLVIEPTEQHRVVVTSDAPRARPRPIAPEGQEVWVLGRGRHTRTCSDGGSSCTQATVATVDVGPFRIDRGAVTVDAYAECVRVGACSEPSHGGDCRWDTGADSQPVNCVDWYQARQFCAWIGQRLPTSDEWELAVNGEVSQGSQYGDEVLTTAATRVASNDGAWEWTDTTVGERMVLARASTGSVDDTRITSRRFTSPDDREETIGFRCRK